MRVRITKDHGKFKAGEVTEVGIADGNELLQSGVAELSKDMTPSDYQTKGVKRSGRSRSVRSNNRRRR